ncbi:MAG: hypothetical protein SF162_18630 [bacterium]|nr:hypothetical protein [bacterium]
MYANNELMFPYHLIPALQTLRGPKWQALIAEVAARSEYHEDTLAFMLMMIRLNGCLACETDSYRAMRGCEACAVQTLRRYKGSDEELIALFEQARADVQIFAQTHKHAHVMREPAINPSQIS